MVKVTIVGVYQHQKDTDAEPQHFALMRDDAGRRFRMWAGLFEAWALSRALEGEVPQTHNMMKMLLDATETRLAEVRITKIHDKTFYATVKLRSGEFVKELDVPPADAITLALLTKSPIFVADDVWNETASEAEWPPPPIRA